MTVEPGPWRLSETTWATVRDTDYHLAVLPWGATEPHNFHLPYGTDVYQAAAVANEAARLAWASDARALVLPAVPFGANEQQMDLRGTINLHPSTQAAVLADVIESLDVQGFTRLVVLNGHGGNDFRAMIRELQSMTDIFLSTVNWFRIPEPLSVFVDPGDHAGDAETSLMLHLRPDLVRPLSEAGSGSARAWTLRGIREGWAWAPRVWREVTEDTGIGDPRNGTAEKGAEYFSRVSQCVSDYLVDVAHTALDALYE
jgi:creatinine amidohydrolase